MKNIVAGKKKAFILIKTFHKNESTCKAAKSEKIVIVEAMLYIMPYLSQLFLFNFFYFSRPMGHIIEVLRSLMKLEKWVDVLVFEIDFYLVFQFNISKEIRVI